MTGYTLRFDALVENKAPLYFIKITCANTDKIFIVLKAALYCMFISIYFNCLFIAFKFALLYRQVFHSTNLLPLTPHGP